uniref:hypothetical protein n=1 Tax=Lachnoclostridium phocaeense TaxID=1871021 RepID=UPI0026DBDA50|nr:hypothetical protein [Lachnoclostridium phocaeense]
MKKALIILAAVFMLGGCGSHVEITDAGKLETYIEEEKAEEYQYLTRVELRKDTAFVRPYVLADHHIVDTLDGATSEGNGISLELELLDGKEQSVGKILESVYKEIISSLDENTSAESTEICNVIEGSGYWIQEIDYTIRDGSTLYPCAVFIKLDQLADGYYLNTVLTLDNSTADDNTAEILEELLDAYGIRIEYAD